MSENSALSRRTIVKGAAWSVPVIAAAVAVPMSAASTTPGTRSVGSLVESSDAVHETNTRLSSARVEECFPNDMFSKTFDLTATLTYAGSAPGFTLRGTTIQSGVPGFWNVVSATDTVVTVTARGTVSCYTGIPALTFQYNLPLGVVPGARTLTANISGVSTDGTLRIDGLIAAVHSREPVVGPRTANAPDPNF